MGFPISSDLLDNGVLCGMGSSSLPNSPGESQFGFGIKPQDTDYETVTFEIKTNVNMNDESYICEAEGKAMILGRCSFKIINYTSDIETCGAVPKATRCFMKHASRLSITQREQSEVN